VFYLTNFCSEVKIGVPSDIGSGCPDLRAYFAAMRKTALVLAVLAVFPTPATADERVPAPRPGAAHAVPLYGEFVRPYDAPDDDPFAPGHRGVDIAAPEGSLVHASSAGRVSFAGSVAGNRSVTIEHGDGIRTSYSFLAAIAVKTNDQVEQGDEVGTVGAGHPNQGLPPHVHLSARRGELYFDPLELYVGDSMADLISLTG
jgi:murein DD-endopeptidase MepM/ murein hydrolase activator NlpD